MIVAKNGVTAAKPANIPVEQTKCDSEARRFLTKAGSQRKWCAQTGVEPGTLSVLNRQELFWMTRHCDGPRRRVNHLAMVRGGPRVAYPLVPVARQNSLAFPQN